MKGFILLEATDTDQLSPTEPLNTQAYLTVTRDVAAATVTTTATSLCS